jgi:hypothetical protein
MPKKGPGPPALLEILCRSNDAGKLHRLQELEQARTNGEIARKIRDLRTAAGLTQAPLGMRIGTTLVWDPAARGCRLGRANPGDCRV